MDLLIALAYDVGGVICHQLPERSFFVDGRQLPVCARCTGLYLSAGMGCALWLLTKGTLRWRRVPVRARTALHVVTVAAVPTVVSYVTGISGVWDGSNLARATLAVPLGLAAGAVATAVATKDLR
jgi:uncharacterized membrane protein